MVKLVVKDGGANKFWSISKDMSRKMIVTNWGKIDGKSRTKEEPYEDECKADANIKKQIEKKMLRGYKLDTDETLLSSNNKYQLFKTKVDEFKKSVEDFKKKTNELGIKPVKSNVVEMKPEPPKTQKRTRCPKGMRKNKDGECVPKDGMKAASPPEKQPQVKTPTPKPAPLPVEKQTKKRTRCPKGMRKNKDGECVPKDGMKAASPPEKQPRVKTPTPTPAPLPVEKQTKKRTRCPKGMRKNKDGECVPKDGKSTKKNNVQRVKAPDAVVEQPKTEAVEQPKKRVEQPRVVVEEEVNQMVNRGEAKAVYDVVKNGVMLAHTYKDPKSGKLKNPVKGFPAAPKGWYASEKFDGYRAIWDGKDFRSRTGKIFEAPQWFKDWLPPSVALDGELFMGRECFEKCGIFRRKVADDKEWREANVTYQIFDMPAMDAPFEDRVAAVNRLVARQCAIKMPNTHGECPLRATEQKVVQTEEEVFKMFDNLVEKGAEGVMLRCPGSPYDAKRSAHLLKVKPFFDAECKIIGYKSGTGKYSGKLGAFHCETVKEPKAKFYISGMTDEVRDNYKKSHPVGTIVTYTYVGVNESGIPRHPNYLRKREAE